MLKLEGVKFPIKFRGMGCGVDITFNNSEDKGVWDTGEVSQLSIGWFINGHNKVNPENSANKGYHYVMSGGPGLCSMHDERKDDRAIFNSAKPEIKPALQCTQIENMPPSATLKGVQLDDES